MPKNNKTEILEFIIDILENDLEVEAQCTANTFLLDVIDSLEWFSLLSKIEDRFQIKISIEDTHHYQLAIIQNLVDYLDKKTDV